MKGKSTNKENVGVDQSTSNNKEDPKKTKFRPLYTKDGKANDVQVQLPGRHACDCQAVKHKLINNCLSCGRVVCAQEGSGECFFCGNIVLTKAEQEAKRVSRQTAAQQKRLAWESRSLYKSNKKDDDSSITDEKAIENKNRLLEYDINCERRTKVIDDESDYFHIDSNKWLTPEQREALKAKDKARQEEKHRSRRDRVMTFDFAGRKVIEDTRVPQYNVEEDQELMKLFKNDQFSVEAEMKRREAEGTG